MKRIILLVSFFIPQSAFAHSTLFVLTEKTFSLSYEQMDFYKAQTRVGIVLMNSKDNHDDLNLSFLGFDYALRLQKDDKVDHRFKFLLLDLRGIMNKTLLEYRNPTDSTIQGKYLFFQQDIKTLEFSNLGISRELVAFQLGAELILENRTNIKGHYRYSGDEYVPNKHSFYFRPKLTLEASNTKLDNVINNRYIHTIKGAFWDIPIGGLLKMGYDWNIENENVNQDNGSYQDYEKLATTSCILLGEYKLYPINDMNKLSFGINAKHENAFIGKLLALNAGFYKNRLTLERRSYYYNSFSIGITYYNENFPTPFRMTYNRSSKKYLWPLSR